MLPSARTALSSLLLRPVWNPEDVPDFTKRLHRTSGYPLGQQGFLANFTPQVISGVRYVFSADESEANAPIQYSCVAFKCNVYQFVSRRHPSSMG